MPKYLIEGTYTPEGLKGLAKDKASGRKAAVQAALKSIKGKMESFHFAFGDYDFLVIVDIPDNVTAAALSLAVGSSGFVRLKTIPLLTIDEVDQAVAVTTKYRAPGQDS